MWRRKLKIKINEVLGSPKTFFLGATIVLVLLAFPLWKNLTERYRISAEISDLEAQIGKTENKNLELQKLIDYLGSDEFVEEQARESLGLKKSNEQVYVVKGLPDTKQVVKDNSVFLVPGLEKAQQKAEVSNPGRWIKYFFANNK